MTNTIFLFHNEEFYYLCGVYRDIEMGHSNFKSSHRKCSVKKGVLKNFANFTGKYFSQACNFIKNETLTLVFSYEVCEISGTPVIKNICERLLLS